MEEERSTGEVPVLREESVEQPSTSEETAAVVEPGKSPGRSRWLLQFGVGAVVACGLVLAVGKRAELSDRILLARARQAMQSGHSYQAARDLEAAHKKQPGDRAVQVALIEAYYRSGAPESARPLQNQVVLTPAEEKRIEPLVQKVESAGEALQQGVDMLHGNQWDQALPLLERAAKEIPDSPVAHAYQAQAYGARYVTCLRTEDLKACQAAVRRVEEIDPKLAAEIKKRLGPLEVLPEVIRHTSAADAALKEGKTDAAVPEIDAADRLYPNSAMVHALRAVVHAQRFEKTGSADEKRQALEEYRTAVQLNPARAAMRERLGKLAPDAAD
jgi:tetratricopeptide (TPR) repeat protein